MTTNPAKIFIQVDSDDVQQENLKNSRRTFKVLQKNAKDKENLVGRPIISASKESHLKQRTDLEEEKVLQKKKKQASSTQVQTDSEESCDQQISEADITSTAGTSQKYWELLAEKRRLALEDALKENECLHQRIQNLEEELKISREMLAESKEMLSVMEEILADKEDEEKSGEGKKDNRDLDNSGNIN
ncbi:hypothetical protein DMENIID0001_126530 [Sergentomyia squamirostris]